jgi:hypothetical protein
VNLKPSKKWRRCEATGKGKHRRYCIVYKRVSCNRIHKHAVFEVLSTNQVIRVKLLRSFVVQIPCFTVDNPLFASAR